MNMINDKIWNDKKKKKILVPFKTVEAEEALKFKLF